VKALLRAVFAALAEFEVLRFELSRAVIGEERAFLGFSERLARRTGQPGVYLRAAAYRRVLKQASAEVHIGFGTCFSKTAATLGGHVYIGRLCSLGWVEIAPEVMIADFVAIPSGGDTHSVSGAGRVPPRLRPNTYTPVRIGEGTWIGSHAVVMADVGEYCVIGAGAVVTKPIPDYSIAVGVPARVVGSTLAGAAAAPLQAAPSRP
jgi:acetyltransferase-like isoleucine patch superfamily enzyme